MEYPEFAKDLYLYHQILATLRNVGMTITSTGSDDKGMTPLYEFKIGYSFLNFGTLVGLLNNPDDFKIPAGYINYLQDRNTIKSEIKIKDFDYEVVARAVDKLSFEGEVKKDIDDDWTDITTKKIKLTEKGLSSLYENKYLKESQKIEYANQIHNSTIRTGIYTRRNIIIALVLSLTTASLLISTFLRDTKRYNKESDTKQLEKKQLEQINQSVQELNQRLQEISHDLQDTSKVKVKIEK